MRNILLVTLLALFVVSCGNSKKEKDKTQQKEIMVIVEDSVEMSFPELPKFSKEVVSIHEGVHTFNEAIQFEGVAVVEGEILGTYNFIFYIGTDTNTEILSNYSLALMVYPEDQTKLTSAQDKKRGFIVKSSKCKIMREGKYPVVLLKDYNIPFKKINTAKAYLYDKSGILKPNKQKLIIGKMTL